MQQQPLQMMCDRTRGCVRISVMCCFIQTRFQTVFSYIRLFVLSCDLIAARDGLGRRNDFLSLPDRQHSTAVSMMAHFEKYNGQDERRFRFISSLVSCTPCFVILCHIPSLLLASR